MWSPDSRIQNANELRVIANKALRYRQLCDRFFTYFPDQSDNARQLQTIRGKLNELRGKALDREKRLAKGVVKIGVVGLEKQGKSAFLSAWLKSERLLPSEAERCTWSTTVVEPGKPNSFFATVDYYNKEDFKKRIASYFEALEPNSVERWEGLDEGEMARLKASFRAREGFEPDDPDRAGRREQTALAELQDISTDLTSIKRKLGHQPERIEAATLDDLAEKIRPYIALKDTQHGNRPYPGVRAVRLVTVTVPVEGAMPGVVLMDLPGIDAPSDKARLDTVEALTNDVDVTIFVKDITRPSLVRNELELLRTAQSADRSISLKDRLFVVLTKIDVFNMPDENGNWHWKLATRNFNEQGVDRIFPYSKIWAHSGANPDHPVARQLMDFYGSTTSVHGLEKLQGAVEHYLSTDVERLDTAVLNSIRREFSELEAQLRGSLVSVKDALSDREFERRAEQLFDLHFEHVRAGEDPTGLLPEIRNRLSKFMDFEMSDDQRTDRAKRADQRISEIRKNLLNRLTPEEAEAKRRQMPSPGLMNETAVEIEMRKQMRERVGAKIVGLGEDFRNTARDSVERMLREMFIESVYEGGRLEVLLPPGSNALVERIDTLGRSGHVSESVVRFQNNEMAKADVAFEVLSRYFARQVIDILDATDPGDRDLRERELQGLEQFFGMGIVDGAHTGSDRSTEGVLERVKAKVGMGEKKDQESSSAMKGFPSGPSAFPTAAPTMLRSKEAEKQNSENNAPPAKVDYPDPYRTKRDWTRMLERVRKDVERICNFLEALAKHPRGLQKYHEEAVRTVHDSWIDREGEQSLRRWVRSECARIWPHKFAAIEAEKERARSDIEAIEELFSGSEGKKGVELWYLIFHRSPLMCAFT
jgi:hypothetical protein